MIQNEVFLDKDILNEVFFFLPKRWGIRIPKVNRLSIFGYFTVII